MQPSAPSPQRAVREGRAGALREWSAFRFGQLALGVQGQGLGGGRQGRGGSGRRAALGGCTAGAASSEGQVSRASGTAWSLSLKVLEHQTLLAETRVVVRESGFFKKRKAVFPSYKINALENLENTEKYKTKKLHIIP